MPDNGFITQHLHQLWETVKCNRAGIIAIFSSVKIKTNLLIKQVRLRKNSLILIFEKFFPRLQALSIHLKTIYPQASELLTSYLVDANTWDEMYKDAAVRTQYKSTILFAETFGWWTEQKERTGPNACSWAGITFTVYSSGEGIEKFSFRYYSS